MSGILILNCHGGITASRLAVSRNRGQGMMLIDTDGAVLITDSVFEYNSLTSVPGGGGLHVIMLHHHHGLKMQISECNFTANSASAGMDTHYYGRPPQFAREVELLFSCLTSLTLTVLLCKVSKLSITLPYLVVDYMCIVVDILTTTVSMSLIALL